jgi:acetoin utilization deacetylase AcuC-like enzyme
MTMLAVASLAGADEHRTPEGHPERAARLDAAHRGLHAAVPEDLIVPVEPTPAPDSTMRAVHTASHLALVRSACERGLHRLDADTSISKHSFDAAARAAGAGLNVIDAIQAGTADRGFVLARPPGHHATSNQAMGFCLVNSIAVAAARLRGEGDRVLIVDWDVHHGNGTQEIFWNEPDVLFVSIHQSPPLYPGSGRVHETGGHDAAGMTINVPLPRSATGDGYRRAIDEVIAPAAQDFAPDWLLISAGFDAHRDDPLAELQLTSTDYGDFTRSLLALVPNAKGVVAFLEGGYDLDAIRHSVAATASALVGIDVEPELRSTGGPGADVVTAAREAHIRALDGAL